VHEDPDTTTAPLKTPTELRQAHELLDQRRFIRWWLPLKHLGVVKPYRRSMLSGSQLNPFADTYGDCVAR